MAATLVTELQDLMFSSQIPDIVIGTSDDNEVEVCLDCRDHTIFSALHFPYGLFPNIDLANLCGYNDHRWSNYLGLRSKAIDLEQRIAEEFVSPQELASLREERVVSSDERGRCRWQIIERLRSVIVSALQGNTLNIQSLRDIVDFMRKHDEQFPEFRSSRTYKLFEPPIFENKKNYHGNFF